MFFKEFMPPAPLNASGIPNDDPLNSHVPSIRVISCTALENEPFSLQMSVSLLCQFFRIYPIVVTFDHQKIAT